MRVRGEGEHALKFHGGGCAARGEAELELRSTINICRQWASAYFRGVPSGDPSAAWCSFYLLPPHTGVVLARTVHMYVCVCVHGRVRTCIPRSVYMISGPPLPLLSLSLSLCAATMSAAPVAAMCGHVCVTARLLPNVRCKFPLSRLTRSAPTFRRIPAPRGGRVSRRCGEGAEARKKARARRTGKNAHRQSLTTRTLNISDDIVDHFSNGFKSESFPQPATATLRTRSDRLIRSRRRETERERYIIG